MCNPIFHSNVEFKAFFHSVSVIQSRSSKSTLYGAGIYSTLFFGLLVASLVLNNSLKTTESNMVFVSQQPLFLPILICVSLLLLFLAVLASINISRERDRGTLEVLVYGPTSEGSFLLGIFIGYLKIYAGALLIIIVWANILTWLLHLAFSLKILFMLISSIWMAAAFIAFGILTAVLGGKARTALVFFFMTLLLMAGIQIADQVVSYILQSTTSASSSMIFLRDSLVTLASGIQWISPFSQFTLIMDSITDNGFLTYMSHSGILVLQTLFLLFSSIWVLGKKGVRG
jgi:hypothetical protein